MNLQTQQSRGSLTGARWRNDPMLAELINRRALKQEARETLRGAQVSPKAFVALYLALILVLDLVDTLSGTGALGIFVMILVLLLALVLRAMITRRERRFAIPA